MEKVAKIIVMLQTVLAYRRGIHLHKDASIFIYISIFFQEGNKKVFLLIKFKVRG